MTDTLNDAWESDWLDDDGNPADETTSTRMTVTSNGVVRSEVRYFGDDGQLAPAAVATRSLATRYDEAGRVVETRWSDEDHGL